MYVNNISSQWYRSNTLIHFWDCYRCTRASKGSVNKSFMAYNKCHFHIVSRFEEKKKTEQVTTPDVISLIIPHTPRKIYFKVIDIFLMHSPWPGGSWRSRTIPCAWIVYTNDANGATGDLEIKTLFGNEKENQRNKKLTVSSAWLSTTFFISVKQGNKEWAS